MEVDIGIFKQKSLNSKYDLHDDYDGELTNLISSMPEDEENMTIQEWVKHNATNCHKLAKQTCNEMIEDIQSIVPKGDKKPLNRCLPAINILLSREGLEIPISN